jgi:hypothetical protein
MSFKILCISGKLGVGKDYIAENIILPFLTQKGHKVMLVALADHFKIETISKDKVPYSDVFYKKTPISRKLLQHRGTEEGRNVYGENIWIDTLLTWMRLHSERSKIDYYIILDCRFKNEIFNFEKLGSKSLRILAPTRNEKKLREESNGDENVYLSIKNHPSETDLDDYTEFDFIYNNDNNGLSNSFNQILNIL